MRARQQGHPPLLGFSWGGSCEAQRGLRKVEAKMNDQNRMKLVVSVVPCYIGSKWVDVGVGVGLGMDVGVGVGV